MNKKDYELNIEFLKRLQWQKGVTEITNLTHNLWGLEKYEELIKKESDLFFVSFIPNESREIEKWESSELPRTKNEHVWLINYMKADFDIRSNVLKYQDRIISNEELLEYKDIILDTLRKDSRRSLNTFNAVVFSWNGIHVYRIWEDTYVEPECYSALSRAVYNRIKEDLKEYPWLWPDFSCWNVGRLMRLPWSYNCKSKYWLPKQEVKILEYSEKDSPLVEKSRWDGYKDRLQELEDVRIARREMTLKCLVRAEIVKNWSTYEKINSKINIADLVCNYTWRTLADDGINFISYNDGKYTGAYIIPEENIVVHMWTPHFSDYYRVYSPFSFILVHYANHDTCKTFKFAKALYPEIEEESWKYLFHKELVKNGTEK